jgi:hypothetical protein
VHPPPAPERAAVLVIRAWPHGEPPTLAARIVWTLDVARLERSTVAATGPDEVARAVAEWLDALLHAWVTRQ